MTSKTATTNQGNVGSIRRRCLVCGERWDAKHPNDPNTMFCPECEEILRAMINERREDKQIGSEQMGV